jgi:hypothetical protein
MHGERTTARKGLESQRPRGKGRKPKHGFSSFVVSVVAVVKGAGDPRT